MKKYLLLSLPVIVFLASNVYTVSAATNPKPEISKSGSTSSYSPSVIGNQDGKRHHLPGMPYFNKFEKHHCIYFNSGQQAIGQGYYLAGSQRAPTAAVPIAGKDDAGGKPGCASARFSIEKLTSSLAINKKARGDF